MRKIIFKTTLAIAAIAAFISCSKSSSNSNNPQSNILGAWKISKQAIDSNCSGTPNKAITYDTVWAHLIITFKSDGTWTETSSFGANAGTYSFVSGNSYIKSTDTEGHPTMYYQVTSLSGSTMVLRDTNASTCDDQITTYAKQ